MISGMSHKVWDPSADKRCMKNAINDLLNRELTTDRTDLTVTVTKVGDDSYEINAGGFTQVLPEEYVLDQLRNYGVEV